MDQLAVLTLTDFEVKCHSNNKKKGLHSGL